MLELNYNGISNRSAWSEAGIKLPQYDPEAVAGRTMQNPAWLHFSAGNLFRAFIASLQDKLLNDGLTDHGIIAVETFDPEILDKVYIPFDNLCIVATLEPDVETAGGGGLGTVIGSISKTYATTSAEGYEAVRRVFINPKLQMISYTATEKAYSLRGVDGEFLPDIKADFDNYANQSTDIGASIGAVHPNNILTLTTAMLHERFVAGAHPIALVSMDNCSRNGERLRASVIEIADELERRQVFESAFVEWLSDDSRVAFPWSMIDKITPWPSETIAKRLAGAGVANMAPLRTARGTVVAPFVNTEPAQYLVIEDNFPGGRPPLEKAGVFFTDRETVDRAERMKVATCLNPLHTALAIFGSLFRYESIAAEMKDETLLALIHRIAYIEGLPAVTDPGVINPRAFLDEVLNERLPNPMIPDTPQRIATDSSQKIPIRFGGTIRYYMEHADFQKYMPDSSIVPAPQGEMATPISHAADLIGIPLVLAGWLRYLLAVDDNLAPYAPSADPLLGTMQNKLSGIKFNSNSADETAPVQKDSQYAQQIAATLAPILSDASLFGADLYEAGLAGKITSMFISMLEGKGAVRKTLEKYL